MFKPIFMFTSSTFSELSTQDKHLLILHVDYVNYGGNTGLFQKDLFLYLFCFHFRFFGTRAQRRKDNTNALHTLRYTVHLLALFKLQPIIVVLILYSQAYF